MKPLIINDKIYGRVKITEPVLIELIKSKPIQRLKKINQHGLRSAIFYDTVNRYEHSVGVMLLLKKFQAPLAEQIAGLFHDIAHTAFSHVVDHAMSQSRTDDFHENYSNYVIKNSRVPKIFKKYHLNLHHLTNEKDFPLVDRLEPHLCADRIDYFLRDSFVCFQFLTTSQVKKILTALTITNNQWAFKDKKTALFFGKNFLRTAQDGWYHPLNHANYHILGRAIKIALEKRLITKKDLFSYDQKLMSRLEATKNQSVLNWLRLLKNFKIKINPKNYTFKATSKFRAADPLIIKNGRLIPLSKIDGQFRQKLLNYKKYIKKSVPIKLINTKKDVLV